jgi:hypothetical protein|nr:MAG TPA: protein of unknown function (DUF3482) [Crassvirales sp.]
MKKKNNKKTIPAYAFGMDQLSNYLGGANVFGSAISGLSEEGSTGDVAGSTIGSAASLAGAGLTVGGPIGAAVGGGLGLVSGLIGSIKRKKQMQALRRRKETLNKTKIGMNAAAETEGEYWDDNALAYTFENGGILSDLAYLDNNEIVRDDSGNIVQVPNTQPGTDNHLIDASALESVLSDKIKRPGTKRTFAKEGQILSKMTKPSKGKDKFAENTNRLNKMNANRAYDRLLAEQEAVKAAKGVKPKVKGIPAYADGKGKVFNRSTSMDPLSIGSPTTGAWFSYPTQTVDAITYANDEPISVDIPLRPIESEPTVTSTYTNASNKQVTKTPSTKDTPKTTTTPQKDEWVYSNGKMIKKLDADNLLPTKKPILNTSMKIDWDNVVKGIDPKEADRIYKERQKYYQNLKDEESNSNSPDWLSLAPTVYNTLQSLRGPEEEPLVLNPYAGAIRSTMARRRMNVEPARLANSRSRAISNYNLANINANTGSNLAARTQAAVDEYASNANMYATKQNADNAYLGEYANTLNNLGQQFVQSENMYNDLNARNRAAARNFGATATSQLGKWSQVNRLMQNQSSRDQMTLPFLADFLSQGFTKEQVDNLLTRTRNRV